MRLLFLSDHLGYAGGVVHGATTYFLNVLHPLKQAGIDVNVCFLRDRHPAADKLEADGIYPIFLNRSKWDPRALSDLLHLIRERDIQVVHAAGMKGILLGRAAARLRGSKIIIHLHDTNTPGRVFRMLHHAMAKWTDTCLAVSSAVGEFARVELGLDADRVITLHNGVALEKISKPSPDARRTIRRQFALPDDVPVIGAIGRLSPEKGHDVLLQAMPELLRTHPAARLLIVGDGSRRLECERITNELDLTEVVRFAGHRSDIPNILAAIDVIALPSHREGLSYTAIEAMAVGRPVVAFAVGGIPEVIDHEKTGLLVPPGDSQSLIAAIRRVLDDRELAHRFEMNARQSVMRFSIDTHVQRLIEEYRRLLGGADCSFRCAAHPRSSALTFNSHVIEQ